MAVKAPQGELKITLVRSLIGYPETQRRVAWGLGLRKPNAAVVRKDCPEIRGMVRKIPHLVKVEVLEKK
ncbi:MAG: 50S ribosomal protein L30 [Candidatus Aminicenantes bacterium]|nr:50S ribosomal protein L30 [Candidatus Aminicenantes bacterium]